MKKTVILVIVLFILLIIFIFPGCLIQEKEMRHLLKQPFDLSPAHKIGDKDFYRIQTIYLEMDNTGKVAQTKVLEGYFSREIQSLKEGIPADNFSWKYVKKGLRKGKGKIDKFSIMPYTRGFQYAFEEWTRDRFPVDLSTVPKTIEGWTFFVKLIDVHTFYVLADPRSHDKKLVHVGDSACIRGEGMPIAIDFPPLFTDTYFENATTYITFRGITVYEEESCAILTFRSDDSRVHLVTNIQNMRLPIEGVSYYHGEILLSLEDRKIVWGKIVERVDSVTNLIQSKTPLRHVTRREITLARMKKSEYDQIDMPKSLS
jgi:hypothetical protein